MGILSYINNSNFKEVGVYDFQKVEYATPFNEIFEFKKIDFFDFKNSRPDISYKKNISEKNIQRENKDNSKIFPYLFKNLFDQPDLSSFPLDEPILSENGLTPPFKTTTIASTPIKIIKKPSVIGVLFKKLYLEGKLRPLCNPKNLSQDLLDIERFDQVFPKITAACFDEACVCDILITAKDLQDMLNEKDLKEFINAINWVGQHRFLHEKAKKVEQRNLKGDAVLAKKIYWLNKKYEPSMREFKRLDISARHHHTQGLK